MPFPTTSRKSDLAKTDDALPYEGQFRNPEVMSCDQLRYWIRELSSNPHWGWSRNKANLGRALGFKDPKAGDSMLAKLRGAWIYPTEQVRLSQRITLLLQGHLLPNYNTKPATFFYANPAKPMVPPPAKLQIKTSGNGPRLSIQPFQAPAQQLPDFRTVFQNARLWKE